MTIIEIGSYIAPAYAGMLLAEQGFEVVKFLSPSRPDPTLTLKHGKEMWAWLNRGKVIRELDASPSLLDEYAGCPLVTNLRPEAWTRRSCNPLRNRLVSWIRGRLSGRSYDVCAQVHSLSRFCPPIPFFLGDTAAGLWAAFAITSAMAQGYATGCAIIYQEDGLSKLVEGELAPWSVAASDEQVSTGRLDNLPYGIMPTRDGLVAVSVLANEVPQLPAAFLEDAARWCQKRSTQEAVVQLQPHTCCEPVWTYATALSRLSVDGSGQICCPRWLDSSSDLETLSTSRFDGTHKP